MNEHAFSITIGPQLFGYKSLLIDLTTININQIF